MAIHAWAIIIPVVLNQFFKSSAAGKARKPKKTKKSTKTNSENVTFFVFQCPTIEGRGFATRGNRKKIACGPALTLGSHNKKRLQPGSDAWESKAKCLRPGSDAWKSQKKRLRPGSDGWKSKKNACGWVLTLDPPPKSACGRVLALQGVLHDNASLVAFRGEALHGLQDLLRESHREGGRPRHSRHRDGGEAGAPGDYPGGPSQPTGDDEMQTGRTGTCYRSLLGWELADDVFVRDAVRKMEGYSKRRPQMLSKNETG